MIKLKDILNEASKSELENVYKPSKYWKDFRVKLRRELSSHKMQAEIGEDQDGNFLLIKGKIRDHVAQFQFFGSVSPGVSNRTVQARSHSGGSDDNELLSKTELFISVDTKNQKVIKGDKVSLPNGIMSLSMVVEKDFGKGTIYVRDSQLKWFHPFKKNIFKMDLGLGTANNEGNLLDYIVKEIKFAVKKRGNRYQSARYKVV